MDFTPDVDPDAFLAHHGVKGQKWGIRRNRAKQLKSFTNADGKKVGPSRDALDANTKRNRIRVGKKAGLHSLSNAELKVLVERMNLEQQYKDLASKDIGTGKALVKKILLGNVERSLNTAIVTTTNGVVKRGSS